MSTAKYDMSGNKYKSYFNFTGNKDLTRRQKRYIADNLADDTVLTLSNNDTSIITKLVEKLDNNIFCHGLNVEYAKNSLQNADAVLIISLSASAFVPVGFATLRFDTLDDLGDEIDMLYADVICTHPKIKACGDIIMKQLDYIYLQNNLLGVYLTSVSSAISFYEKYGYIKKNDTSGPDLCLMIKGDYDEIIDWLNY